MFSASTLLKMMWIASSRFGFCVWLSVVVVEGENDGEESTITCVSPDEGQKWYVITIKCDGIQVHPFIAIQGLTCAGQWQN